MFTKTGIMVLPCLVFARIGENTYKTFYIIPRKFVLFYFKLEIIAHNFTVLARAASNDEKRKPVPAWNLESQCRHSPFSFGHLLSLRREDTPFVH